MQLVIQASPWCEVQFSWFWPQGENAGVMVTHHHVEEQRGANLCEMVMDIDNSFNIKTTFN